MTIGPFALNADGDGEDTPPILVEFTSDDGGSWSDCVIASLSQGGAAFGQWLNDNAEGVFLTSMLQALREVQPWIFTEKEHKR